MAGTHQFYMYGCYKLETDYRNLMIFSFFASLLAFKTPQDHFIFKCFKFYFSLFGEISPVRKSAAHWVGGTGHSSFNLFTMI
jgi:hypothetical protein